MSFAFEIKKEILNKKYTNKELYWLITGIIFTHQNNDFDKYQLKINNVFIRNFLFKGLNNINIKFTIRKNIIFLKWHFLNLKSKYLEHFLSGVFINSGSISKKEASSYHIEFKFTNLEHLKYFIEILATNNLHFTSIQRKNHFVVYAKKSETISDFLKIIKTNKALFSFEGVRIERDYTNHFNRYINLDVSNQEKIAKAFLNFRMMYFYLQQQNKLESFNHDELNCFEIKINNPYKSLNEIAKIYWEKHQKSISKSGINHWMRKLKCTYDKEINNNS